MASTWQRVQECLAETCKNSPTRAEEPSQGAEPRCLPSASPHPHEKLEARGKMKLLGFSYGFLCLHPVLTVLGKGPRQHNSRLNHRKVPRLFTTKGRSERSRACRQIQVRKRSQSVPRLFCKEGAVPRHRSGSGPSQTRQHTSRTQHRPTSLLRHGHAWKSREHRAPESR